MGAFTLNISQILQSFGDNESQLVFDYTLYILLLVCLMAASIFMMLIPVVIAYSAIDHFLTMRSYQSQIKNEVCCEEHNTKYLNTVCSNYLKASCKFYKNFLALAVWNIFSLGYMVFGFDSFSSGLKEYFYFPFAVLQSLSKNEIFSSVSKFQSNWYYMLMIALLTFIFYFVGHYLGKQFANGAIKKRGINFLFRSISE